MSVFTLAESRQAQQASDTLQHLQQYFAKGLESVGPEHKSQLTPLDWGRDGGKHGGGVRYGIRDTALFNRASLNFSQVHYEDLPDKALNSATALSTIVHPQLPHLPSLHMHISFTELKNGRTYWRLMGDLNPSAFPGIQAAWAQGLKQDFLKALIQEVRPLMGDSLYIQGIEDGERYFYIPALERHRGVAHFYLEAFSHEDFDSELELAHQFGKTVIDTYVKLLKQQYALNLKVTDQERLRQLNYHTLYFFQVMTLDRGTTSGLLIHNQNDQGILGSLPSHVNLPLLESWAKDMPESHKPLLHDLVKVLSQEPLEERFGTQVARVSETAKLALAEAVRQHYQAHPENLALQAAGKVIPPTVANHLSAKTWQ